MQTTPTVRRTVPPTVWLTCGRHAGDSAEELLRRSLRRHKDSRRIDDYLEITDSGSPEKVFEARTRVAGGVTVRARLSLAPATQHGQDWTLVAEAEQPWDQSWPSPAGMFWPQDPDADWRLDASTGLRVGALNPLPEEDKAVRRRLRACARDTWRLHVVVHEAMTTDERGQVPLAHWLPPGLRDRVVEHRAAPHQHRVLNWALREFHAEVPRGGAVLLPGRPAPEGYQADAFAVRAVFLDGSEPVELVDAVRRFDALPRPLPDGALDELTALREDWHLLTLEEELARERALVKMYAEALEAMTRSRDLYREAAERAHEALAAYRDSAVPSPGPRPLLPGPASPLRALTRRLERLKVTPRVRRGAPAARTETPQAPPAGGTDDTPAEPAPAAAEQRTVADTPAPGTETSGPEDEVSAPGTEKAGRADGAQERAAPARR